MGRGLAKLLAQKGANVVIVARDQQKLDDALKYISVRSLTVKPIHQICLTHLQPAAKNPQSQRFHAISADMIKAEENTRLIVEVTAWNNGNPPDIVWANAGSSRPSLFIDTPIDILRSQMEINYWAACYLAHATLKAWLKPAKQSPKPSPRHFIMTSSTACFVGVAGYAPYSPAKSALRSLADTLRSELNLYNGYRRSDTASGLPAADIKIHCVVPGTIISPGHVNEEKTKHEITRILEKGDPAQSEDEVAAAAVRGLERGGYLVTTQLLGHAMRAGALGGSPRDHWLIDTLFAWLVAPAWLWIGPEMEGKVWEFGKKEGVKLPE